MKLHTLLLCNYKIEEEFGLLSISIFYCMLCLMSYRTAQRRVPVAEDSVFSRILKQLVCLFSFREREEELPEDNLCLKLLCS